MLKYSGPLDLVFQALADPHRREIVEQLSRGPASLGELAAPLPISLPAVHQHVKVLEASGVISTQKVGRVRTCRLELTTLGTAEAWIEDRRASWERRLDRLAAVLASLPPEPSPNPDPPNSDPPNSDPRTHAHPTHRHPEEPQP